MSAPWPVSFLRPFPEHGSGLAGWSMRGQGALAVLALALGLFGIGSGLVLLATGGSDGFADLAGAISIALGVLFVAFGIVVSGLVHVAYAAWSGGWPSAPSRMAVLGAAVILVGLVLAALLIADVLVVDGQMPLAVVFGLFALSGAAVLVGRPNPAD